MIDRQFRISDYMHNLLKMKIKILQIFLLAWFLLSSCSQGVQVTPSIIPEITSTLPDPQILTTRMPDSSLTAKQYLNAWMQNDFLTMYSMLSSKSKEKINLEQFTKQYLNVMNEMALKDFDYSLNQTSKSAAESSIPFRVTYRSSLIGDIQRDLEMQLENENGAWRIVWDPSIIMPELVNENSIRMEYDIPIREAIYDRNGDLLAGQTEATAIGLYPDYVNLDEDGGLIGLISRLTGIKSTIIRSLIENSLPGSYLPIGEVESSQDPRGLGVLSDYGAVASSPYNSRFYPGGGIAPHLVGYVSAIQQDEINEMRRSGYRGDERIGRDGIERWGNSTLAGKIGGTLYVLDKEDKPVSQIGSVASMPGQKIYSTIDRDFQKGVQQAINGFNGAIVILEKDTGRVLAIASSPKFNSNAYEFENPNWQSLLSEISTNPNNPQFNRATLGQYPLGSVFKVITMAAALESGLYKPDTIYECGYIFDELPGFPRYDWTYDRFQNDGRTKPSGSLTLVNGLIRSCNPYFWHIGLDLFNQGLTETISDMARGFGLGSPTGIEVVDEEPGKVPDPQSQVDAINSAIGQGDLLVTPLQVANFMAALGNGGTLFRPQAIEKIVSTNDQTTYKFQPEVKGKLPISSTTLKTIQEGMIGVVSSEKPEGTAYRVFNGLDIPVAAKTGTATWGSGLPHSWFAGYTLAGQPNRPDIAIAVIAENAGEGSEIAAPIFRRIVELYFYGDPKKLYRWEASVDVTKTPTPLPTESPTPLP